MHTYRAAPVAQQVKKSTCKAGDTGDESSIRGSGRSPGGGNSNPLQVESIHGNASFPGLLLLTAGLKESKSFADHKRKFVCSH